MPALGKFEEPLGRLREAREIFYRAAKGAGAVVGNKRADSLRARIDVVVETDPRQSGRKRFRTAAVELAVLAHLHRRTRLRDDAMSVACQLRREEESCHCGCGGKCGNAKRGDSRLAEPGAVPEVVYDVLRSPGEPLDARTRSILQDYFSEDLGNVRIHATAGAAAALGAMNASAFAVGNHVVLEPGFASNPPASLLVHEVAHVLQQRNGGRTASALRVQQDVPWEREADEAAGSFHRFHATGVRCGTLRSLSPSETALQRQSFPAQCLDICPLRVPSRFPPAPCLLTNCERLGFFPPVFARSWCVYLCPGTWEGPEAAWLINTIFGTIGPHYTS